MELFYYVLYCINFCSIACELVIRIAWNNAPVLILKKKKKDVVASVRREADCASMGIIRFFELDKELAFPTILALPLSAKRKLLPSPYEHQL